MSLVFESVNAIHYNKLSHLKNALPTITNIIFSKNKAQLVGALLAC